MTAALLSLLAFAIVASATPGPNNVMIMATAARHGLRATLPMILGVDCGFAFMVAVVNLGCAGVLAAHPALQTAARWIGAAWLLVLAWQVARPDGHAVAQRPERPVPLGFWGACAFQWINPKAWVLALAAATTYSLPITNTLLRGLVPAAVFGCVCAPLSVGWALLGSGTGRLLRSPGRVRVFDMAMGALLAASVVPALLE